MLEQVAHVLQEAGRLGAVDDAVVARERDVHRRARDDGAVRARPARSATSPTARIAACGGLMTALKRRTPNMPRFETVNVPSPSCSAVSDLVARAVRERARLVRRARTPTCGRRRTRSGRSARRRSPRRCPRSRGCAARRPSSYVAFSAGNSRSASATARTTRSLNDGERVDRGGAPAPRAVGAAASMSTSASSVNSGIDARDSAMRRAIVRCVAVSSTGIACPRPGAPSAPAPGTSARDDAAARARARDVVE